MLVLEHVEYSCWDSFVEIFHYETETVELFYKAQITSS